MKDREKEYREIFIAEALQEYDELSQHIVALEKNPDDDKLLAEIFRLLHNLKANAKATGFDNIASIAHKLESVFGLIRSGEIHFEGDTITVLFDGFDYLGLLLHSIDDPKYQEPNPELIRNLDFIASADKEKIEKAPVRKIYASQRIALSDLIYIQVKKLDDMMNLVGELIIDRDQIMSLAKQSDSRDLKTVSAHLERITRELQDSIMSARLVNIGSLFSKFPRIVRDVALTESKKVELKIKGQDVQIDRNILQIITDALLHIVRNAISHGIEDAETRKRQNKPEAGHITLSATTDKDIVVLQVTDDGRGIDIEQVKKQAVKGQFISQEKADTLNESEILSFIFEPGFSMAKEVTEFSGRGVGLDIVKTALDTIGGKVNIDSKEGEGTVFSLYLPNSIAVKGALLFTVAGNFYAVPLIHTESVVTIKSYELHSVGTSLFADIKGETIPVFYLREFFLTKKALSEESERELFSEPVQDIIIISYNNRKLGLIVDKLLRQQDIVVKMLQKPMDNIELFGGVTLLGNGEICLVLDIPYIARHFMGKRGELLPDDLKV